MNYMIDFMFISDLILGFFTTFVDQKGYEIYDSKRIAHHHAGKTVFYFDFLSICGNKVFQRIDSRLRYLQMFKLFRIF